MKYLNLSGSRYTMRQHRLHRKMQTEIMLRIIWLISGLAIAVAIAVRFAVGGEYWVL